MTMAFSRFVSSVVVCLLLCTESTAFVLPKAFRTSSGVPLQEQHAPLPSTRPRTRCYSAASTIRTKALSGATSLSIILFRELKELSVIQKTLLATTFAIGFFMGRANPFWKRFTSVVDIQSKWFGPTAPLLRGRAVRVSDGDTIRFLHVPTPLHPKALQKKEKASTTALPIRICTIDTPETAKFGKPGQPFGKEAKANLKSLLEGRVVSVRMLQKDQYGRAVGEVFVGRWPFRKHADEEMLKEGLAEVYTGSGAVYGPLGLDTYLELEEEAKESKRGIWSQKNRESAADYKKRTK